MHCILEQREHTAVANTHVEDLWVWVVVVLLNDMTKLTLSDADLTVLTTFVRKRLMAKVCRIMIYGHMHCIDTCPLSLTHTHPPESSRTHRLSVGRRHTHMCSSHPTLRTSKKQKMTRTFYFSSHVCYVLSLRWFSLKRKGWCINSSVSISLSFWEPRYQSSRRLLKSPTHLHNQTKNSQPTH